MPCECMLCQTLLPSPVAGPVCRSCVDALPRLLVGCPRCGLYYPPGVAPGRCGPCRTGRSFRRARSAFAYEDGVRRLLHALKFGGVERIAKVLGSVAASTCLGPGRLEGYAGIVPVPLSPRRRRERGFNQAERIARAVSAWSGDPILGRVLTKRERPPQSGLSRKARKRNVTGAFEASPLPARARSEALLLVDDVFTTGATAEAASRALTRAGARAVDVLTLARVGNGSRGKSWRLEPSSDTINEGGGDAE